MRRSVTGSEHEGGWKELLLVITEGSATYLCLLFIEGTLPVAVPGNELLVGTHEGSAYKELVTRSVGQAFVLLFPGFAAYRMYGYLGAKKPKSLTC